MERRHTPRPQRVLIAEDNDDLRQMWWLWLTFFGFSVECARNGLEAVGKALASRPDLVLMDLWMPALNGLEATARLRSEPETSTVPVLAMSADISASAADAARQAGCAAFLPKPLLPDELLAHLRAAFAERRRALAQD